MFKLCHYQLTGIKDNGIISKAGRDSFEVNFSRIFMLYYQGHICVLSYGYLYWLYVAAFWEALLLDITDVLAYSSPTCGKHCHWNLTKVISGT